MENMMGDWEEKKLRNELAQGRELAKQLEIHLNGSSSSQETRDLLVQNMVTSYEKALLMPKWRGSMGDQSQPTGVALGMSDAQWESWKTLTQVWTQQVQVCRGRVTEIPPEDGYCWRKYGQEEILGARFPRGYYGCNHRNVQGCLATKQVQRSDEDPTIFEITYRGRHTCTQASHQIPSNESNNHQQHNHQPQQNQQPSLEMLSEYWYSNSDDPVIFYN